jgi:hypothetical protein
VCVEVCAKVRSELRTSAIRLLIDIAPGVDQKWLFARAKLQEAQMSLCNLFDRTGRSLAVGAAILAAVGLTTVPRPAHAVSNGAAVGIGLGGLALGTALGAAANPYYNSSYYPYGSYYPPAPAYAPAPAYYPPSSYYQPRTCWDAVYGRYYAC